MPTLIATEQAPWQGAFQPVGAGTHYLAAGSSHRDAGTYAISRSLLAELRDMTTFPPIDLGSPDPEEPIYGPILQDSVLLPRAQRDYDAPDLGYHYWPLHWLASGLEVSDATLKLLNGVGIGVYGTTGVDLQAGGKLVSVGTPVHLNRIVRYQAVQEEPGVGLAAVRDAARDGAALYGDAAAGPFLLEARVVL